ncbi:MAG: radical SAM protein [Oligoflexia bacterium]|nr:radical SAM protein [Oligoflexia bacterium]
MALAASEASTIHRDLSSLAFKRVLFAACPTGAYCREDRCQSFFKFELIPSMRPPMEDCEAAGAVSALGAAHQVIDAPAERLSRAAFLKSAVLFSPDLIILAVTFGSLEADLAYARELKELIPGALIGLRGAPCYVQAESLLQENPQVAFCLNGDYEIAVGHCVERGINTARGVIWRDKYGAIIKNNPAYAEDLDLLPLPDRSTIDHSLYTVRGLRSAQATVHVQRGCPFPCSFCLVHTVSGNRARHRSPASVADEIRSLMDQGLRYFYLRADTFTLNKKWAIAISQALQQRCPGARWVTATRVECVDDATIAAMRAGGCYGISFGVDVASEEIGARVHKKPALAQAAEAMRLCDRYGVISLAYLMIGFIWESRSTLAETAAFARAIRPDLITLHYAHPYPGTAYYQAVKEAGLAGQIAEKAQAEPAVDLPGLSAAELSAFGRKLLLQHYIRPSVVGSLVRKLAGLQIERRRSTLEATAGVISPVGCSAPIDTSL